MLEDYTPDIVKIRKHFVSEAKMAAKYSDYLFMIAPFYHKIFTTYKRMILLDADLKVCLHKESFMGHIIVIVSYITVCQDGCIELIRPIFVHEGERSTDWCRAGLVTTLLSCTGKV